MSDTVNAGRVTAVIDAAARNFSSFILMQILKKLRVPSNAPHPLEKSGLLPKWLFQLHEIDRVAIYCAGSGQDFLRVHAACTYYTEIVVV